MILRRTSANPALRSIKVILLITEVLPVGPTCDNDNDNDYDLLNINLYNE